MRPPSPPPSRPLLPPRAQRASGREASGRGRPVARRRAVRSRKATSTTGRGGTAADELPYGRGERGEGGRDGRREGGGDNINSADDKMMRGVFSLAE